MRDVAVIGVLCGAVAAPGDGADALARPTTRRSGSASPTMTTRSPGELADALVLELNAYLGSPDPQLRDDCAYSIAAAWIYRDKRLSPETMRSLLATWTGNLRKGLGETGTDALLLRSFSALDLSTLAALDNATPFLTRASSPPCSPRRSPTSRGRRTSGGSIPTRGGCTPRPTRPTCSSSWGATRA